MILSSAKTIDVEPVNPSGEIFSIDGIESDNLIFGPLTLVICPNESPT
jgi:hypothetical protein